MLEFAQNSIALRDEEEWLKMAKADNGVDEALLATIVEVEKDVKRRQEERNTGKAEIESLISKCTDPIIRSSLMLHYISGYAWKEVAIALHKTEPAIRGAANRFTRKNIPE